MTSFRKMSGTCKTQDVWWWRSRIHALIIPDMSVRNNGKVIVDGSSECRKKGTVEWLLIRPSTKNVRRHSGTDAKKSVSKNLLTIDTGMGPAAPLAQLQGDTRYPMLNEEVWGTGSTLPRTNHRITIPAFNHYHMTGYMPVTFSARKIYNHKLLKIIGLSTSHFIFHLPKMYWKGRFLYIIASF